MAIENIDKYLQGLRLFLDKMRDQEQMAAGEKQFESLLSAFVNAGVSLRRAFHIKQNRKRNQAIKEWKKAWERQLTPEQMRIYDFMRDERNSTAHGDAFRHIVKGKKINIGFGGSYSDKSGTFWVMGSPTTLLGHNIGATITMPQYFFDIDGVERRAIEVCAEYLTLLEQMVAQFKSELSSR